MSVMHPFMPIDPAKSYRDSIGELLHGCIRQVLPKIKSYVKVNIWVKKYQDGLTSW